MNEEFNNEALDYYCAFTDDGIIYKSNVENIFFPYGSIEKIGYTLGFLSIKGSANGKALGTVYPLADKQQKARIKELIEFAKMKMKTAERADAVLLKNADEIKAEKLAQMHEEIRMRCNVCGNVFCYTLADVAESERHAKMAQTHSVSGLFNAIGGTKVGMYGQQQQAEIELSKVVDYTRCPSCRSADLVRLSDGEESSPNISSDNTQTSAVEEIKKFKELLDMGVITQEEFDAKKKQLLGL